MKLDASIYRRFLQDALLRLALSSQEGGARQQECLLGAGLLENGKQCPRWIARHAATVAFQDAYGAMGMAASRREIDEIFDSCIER